MDSNMDCMIFPDSTIGFRPIKLKMCGFWRNIGYCKPIVLVIDYLFCSTKFASLKSEFELRIQLFFSSTYMPLLRCLSTHPFCRSSVSIRAVVTDEQTARSRYWHKWRCSPLSGVPAPVTPLPRGPNNPVYRISLFLVESFVPPTAVVQKLIYMLKTKGYCGRDFSSAAASAFRSTERAFHASACPSVCQAVSRWIRLGADSCWQLWCIVAPDEIDIDTCAEEKVVGLG